MLFQPTTFLDGLIKRYPLRWLRKKPKIKAREPRDARRNSSTPQRRDWAFYEAILLFLLMLAAGGCTHLQPKPPDEPPAPAVRNLETVREILQAADAASAHLLLTEIGRVNVPALDGPIWRVAYRPFQAGLKQVLVLAGLHGNGTAGVDYVLTLIQRLSSATPSVPPCDIDILPLINPWGWVHDRPSTPSGIDIADDFTRFDSHEARVLRRFLREKRYDLVLDLREDPAAMGFQLRQYGMGSSQASVRTVDRVRRAGYPIENDPGRIILRPSDGIVDIPLWSLRVWPLTRWLTIGGYMRRNVSTSVFSIITPARLPLVDRIAMQGVAVEALLAGHAESKSETAAYPK